MPETEFGPGARAGTADPAVSVVVPTFNRSELLRPLADALLAQTGAGRFEVIFVDDASTDGTPDVLSEIVGSAGTDTVRVLRTGGNVGPAAARNLGWRAGRAPYVVFTDDDCLPEPGWLAALVAALEEADVAQGLVEVDQVEALNRGPFGRILVITRFSWKFETCNIAYRREILESVGGFDETFRMLGEDVDLGLRAVERGARTDWVPDAVVKHRVEYSESRLRDWRASLRYAWRCDEAALVVRRHPGWRRHLFARVFYKPYHAFTLGTLVAILAAPRHPRAAVALAAPWFWYRIAVDPRIARARWLPATLALGFLTDAAELTATVKGAARHRTLLL